MTVEKSNLDNLKESYKVIHKKYNLPSFDDLNKDFKIEKIAEVETDFLIREIRLLLGEGLESFLRIVEAMLNPVNVPMFLYPIVKALGADEKAKLMEIHKDLSKMMFDSMKLIIEYDENKEADYISKGFKSWQIIKKDFSNILESIEGKLDVKKGRERNYFG